MRRNDTLSTSETSTLDSHSFTFEQEHERTEGLFRRVKEAEDKLPAWREALKALNRRVPIGTKSAAEEAEESAQMARDLRSFSDEISGFLDGCKNQDGQAASFRSDLAAVEVKITAGSDSKITGSYSNTFDAITMLGTVVDTIERLAQPLTWPLSECLRESDNFSQAKHLSWSRLPSDEIRDIIALTPEEAEKQMNDYSRLQLGVEGEANFAHNIQNPQVLNHHVTEMGTKVDNILYEKEEDGLRAARAELEKITRGMSELLQRFNELLQGSLPTDDQDWDKLKSETVSWEPDMSFFTQSLRMRIESEREFEDLITSLKTCFVRQEELLGEYLQCLRGLSSTTDEMHSALQEQAKELQKQMDALQRVEAEFPF